MQSYCDQIVNDALETELEFLERTEAELNSERMAAAMSEATPARVYALTLSCSCGHQFVAYSWAIRPRVWVFCPSCGRHWSVPASRFRSAGRVVPWSAWAVPDRGLPVAPPQQLSLFD